MSKIIYNAATQIKDDAVLYNITTQLEKNGDSVEFFAHALHQRELALTIHGNEHGYTVTVGKDVHKPIMVKETINTIDGLVIATKKHLLASLDF